MKKMIYWMLALFICSAVEVKSQIAIGTDQDPVPGAILELVSSSKALLLPSVTSTERNNLSTPGLMVYNYMTQSIEFCCNNGQWKTLKADGAAAVNITKVSPSSAPIVVTGTKISDNLASTASSKESVLELESSNKALILPTVTGTISAKSGLLCFKMDNATTGRLSFCVNGTNWLSR